MIEVVDHDPRWASMFDELRRRCAEALDGVPIVSIEHVGSTSVPGLAAKPVIDLDVVVARADVDAAIRAFVAIGFTPLGEMGVADRFALRRPDGWIRSNTYVAVEGSLALRNHLAVRTVLRADPALRDEYGAVKRQLASETDDIAVYVEGKSAVLRRILERGGLSTAELDAIEAANRAC